MLIDHAWGWEPTRISDIKSFKPSSNSISSGQVLMEPYPFDKAEIIVMEMTELLVFDLVRKGFVTKQIGLSINYDRDSLRLTPEGYKVSTTNKIYTGTVSLDYYGRPAPKEAHGAENLQSYTSSTRQIMNAMTQLFKRIVDPDLLVRKVVVVANRVLPESEAPEEIPDIFTDFEKLAKQKEDDEHEKKLQKATIELQNRFGKNIVLKGFNFSEGATSRERNAQIGGHKASGNPDEEVIR